MDRTELIDRIALLEMLPQICDGLNGCSAPYNFDEHCVGCEVYMLHKMLTDMPAIDVQPVRRGEWVQKEIPTGYFTLAGNMPWVCSACEATKSWDLTAPADNFRPNCGADMRGEADETRQSI